MNILLFFPSLINLLIIYWTIQFPNRFTIKNGFFFGLIMDFFLYSYPGTRAIAFVLLTSLTKFRFYSLSKSSIFEQIINIILLSLIIKVYVIFLEFLTIYIFYPKLYISCIIDGAVWPVFRFFMRKFSTLYKKYEFFLN